MTGATQLAARYADPLAGARAAAAAGIPIIGITSNTVPWEPFIAAGCFPVVLNPSPRAADENSFSARYMEAVFEERIRYIFDMVASAADITLRSVVIPRTSEQEHKLFLYLRELARLGAAPALPEVHLYNLLHTRSPESESYGLAATRALIDHAASVGPKPITHASLRAAIDSGNRARAALSALHIKRFTFDNTVSGTEALQWTGAFYFTDRDEYATQLEAAIQSRSTASPRTGKRIIIKGAPLSYLGLHQAIEQHHATVIAEDDWWGTRTATPGTATNIDPARAIFRACYLHEQSPRIFPHTVAEDIFLEVAHQADAIVFYLPSEDDTYGWDYPRWRDVLNGRGTPHFLVREDGRNGMTPAWHDDFEAFLSTL